MQRNALTKIVAAIAHKRPAIVRATSKDIDLVATIRSLLGLPDFARFRIHGQAVTVAMTTGENCRLDVRPSKERIILRNRSIVFESDGFARIVSEILRPLDLFRSGCTDAHI